jgi:hypothetical protein
MGLRNGRGSTRDAAAQPVVDSQLAGELGHVAVLVGCQERDPDALAAGPARATDAVYIGLAVGGRIEVDHV